MNIFNDLHAVLTLRARVLTVRVSNTRVGPSATVSATVNSRQKNVVSVPHFDRLAPCSFDPRRIWPFTGAGDHLAIQYVAASVGKLGRRGFASDDDFSVVHCRKGRRPLSKLGCRGGCAAQFSHTSRYAFPLNGRDHVELIHRVLFNPGMRNGALPRPKRVQSQLKILPVQSTCECAMGLYAVALFRVCSPARERE
jgi:hypothetical protein